MPYESGFWHLAIPLIAVALYGIVRLLMSVRRKG